MKDAVNMVKLVEELAKRPRGKACIVLTHDYTGQKPWAAELAQQTGSEHLDLLEVFAQNPDLADLVSTFSVGSLFNFVKQHRNAPVLIVSGLEFLKAAWSAQPQAMQEFASRVESACVGCLVSRDVIDIPRPPRVEQSCKFLLDFSDILICLLRHVLSPRSASPVHSASFR